MSKIVEPKEQEQQSLDLSGSRYDQSMYWGRVRHFMEVTDPRTLFASDAELQRAKQLIEQYNAIGKLDKTTSLEEYWQAKKLYAATFHPDTGEKVFLPFRMSCFVPTNLFIIAGMLLPNPSTAAILFWQWCNQSVNVAINWANANKTAPLSTSETATAYAVATSVSCTVALGLNRLAERNVIAKRWAKFIPFAAVALAGTANVFLMRQKELREGIAVQDEHGAVVGKSRRAGFQAVSQVAVSRIATALPCLTIAPLVMARLERTAFFRQRPRMLVPVNLGVIAASLMTALPCAIGLFPQQASIDVDKLESEFQQRQGSDGQELRRVYYNKGL
ncbi:Sideroflexin FSF1 [Sorochytrium milnesiophthora]